MFGLLGFAGCFSETRIEPYPEDWPAVATIIPGHCPDITGQFENLGSAVSKFDWKCENMLSCNALGFKMAASERDVMSVQWVVDWIEIRQPDPDTLEFHFPQTIQIEPKILKRSKGDFDCDSSGLNLSWSINTLTDDKLSVGQKIFFTLFLTGGRGSRVQVFRPLRDRSLLMEEKDSVWWTHLLVTLSLKRNAFVRWERYQPPPKPTPTAVSPSSP